MAVVVLTVVVEPSVAVAQEVPIMAITEEIAVSPRARIARLAALVVAAAAAVEGPCPMWDVVKASTSKRPRTSTLDVEAISMQSAPEEISRASLQRVAC